MDMTIGRGRGYVPVGEKETKHLSLGTIAIDSLYTPIRDVGYHVEMTRVGDVTDYEKLTMTIETNGTVTPKDAIVQATKILMDHFALIVENAGGANANEEKETEDTDNTDEPEEKKPKRKKKE
jgi:DNA-directed RNA polymerase subunit alpha